MKVSARMRKFMISHDVVGAAARLGASCAVAALILAAVVVLAPATLSAGLVAMTAAMAKVFGVATGAGVVLWVLAVLERGAATEELVEEISAFLEAAPS
jgi:hypothetical protein